MLSSRTIYSLAQYMALQDQDFAGALLSKHGLNGWSVQITTQVLSDMVTALKAASEEQLSGLLGEIARTQRDLRSRVNPKYRYDERFDDLLRCLELDGYRLDNSGLTSLDPSVVGTPPLDDDLVMELNSSRLPNVEQIIQKLEDSTDAFRSSTPNVNACLNDARIALETLARGIAETRKSAQPGNFDPKKWGSIIAYLRDIDFINIEEERGLAGVYGFVSPGSHLPLGLTDQEFARLGRSFVLGMCWFLVKRYRAGV